MHTWTEFLLKLCKRSYFSALPLLHLCTLSSLSSLQLSGGIRNQSPFFAWEHSWNCFSFHITHSLLTRAPVLNCSPRMLEYSVSSPENADDHALLFMEKAVGHSCSYWENPYFELIWGDLSCKLNRLDRKENVAVPILLLRWRGIKDWIFYRPLETYRVKWMLWCQVGFSNAWKCLSPTWRTHTSICFFRCVSSFEICFKGTCLKPHRHSGTEHKPEFTSHTFLFWILTQDLFSWKTVEFTEISRFT